jgi:ABC-type cobalamin/Fe3+-siderophores transport system ATPase subunit
LSDSIILKDLGFRYEEEKDIFKGLSLALPGGLTTLVGQNGTGKSTFLLLAGGRVLPDEGSVTINGRDSREIRDEDERNRLVSFIYQNMEFESEETSGTLLEYVAGEGHHKDGRLLSELIEAFELKDCLNRKFHENSKGDIQKICIAFSLLYGSPYIMMDEPVFALEHIWKERVLEYLKDYTRRHETAVYFSLHELDLSRKYSDNALLFHKDNSIILGPSSQVLERDFVEKAYQVPMELLYQREHLFRDHLLKPADMSELSGQNVKVVE